MTRRDQETLSLFPDSREANNILHAQLIELRCRVEQVIRATAEEVRPCRACGTQLFFVPNKATKKLMPLEKDGANHFATCPHAEEFRARKAKP